LNLPFGSNVITMANFKLHWVLVSSNLIFSTLDFDAVKLCSLVANYDTTTFCSSIANCGATTFCSLVTNFHVTTFCFLIVNCGATTFYSLVANFDVATFCFSIANYSAITFCSWIFLSQQTFLNFLFLPIAILQIQTKTLVNNHIDFLTFPKDHNHKHELFFLWKEHQ
jgi:hypothetical protein